MKLNWFSPLPPARTDIAHYTARVLPALSAVADVTAWTTSRNWSKSLEKFATVHRYGLDRLPWTELNRADMTFYHIGNNPRFHWPIWHVSRVHPGTVVLHDFRLHHFFDGVYRLRYQDINLYLDVMETYYGPSALADAEECFKSNGQNIDYMSERYPLTELAIGNALGVLVHSQEAFAALQQKAASPFAYAPLPYPSQRKPISRPPGPPYQLIVFGYLGRNRRLDSIIEALGALEERELFRLRIFGGILESEASIRSRVRALNLSGLVSFEGFVPEEKLDSALESAHLAFNLRYPTVGEASGSQLRIWAHALPSLVSPVGWYASLPADTVLFVRPDENEIFDIQQHLHDLIKAPDQFTQMGMRGSEELERNHSPESYASQIIELAKRAERFRPQMAAYVMARRAGMPLIEWLTSRELDEPLQHIVNEAVALVKN